MNKLRLSLPLKEIIAAQQQTNGVEILPVTPDYVFALEDLALHHKDPFDRLLIAQAIDENATFISADPNLTRYPVQVIW